MLRLQICLIPAFLLIQKEQLQMNLDDSLTVSISHSSVDKLIFITQVSHMQWGRLQQACIAGGRNSAWKRGCQLPQNCHWQYPFACIVISVLSDSVTQVLRKCSTYPGKHKQIQTSVGRKSKRFSVTFFFFQQQVVWRKHNVISWIAGI